MFAKANPKAAMLINWKMYPQVVPKNVPFLPALNQALQVFEAYLSYIGPSDGKYGFMPPTEMDELRPVPRGVRPGHSDRLVHELAG